MRWRGQTVVCLASGPSMTQADAEYVRGRARVITVNSTWRLAPWADAHYTNDHDLLAAQLPEMRARATGEIWCGHPTWRHDGVRSIPYNKRMRGVSRVPGRLAWGGNSGYAALNLAYQLGAARILMLGFDQSDAQGAHWHGEHPDDYRRAFNWPMWSERFAEAARDYRALDVDVVNCSRRTTLTCFRVAALESTV
jgi:hypothetical protein